MNRIDGGEDAKLRWQKSAARSGSRGDGFRLKRWARPQKLERRDTFARFNYKTAVVQFHSHQEYTAAGLHQLPSSSSWTYLETAVLQDLCITYDLRFVVIADRFSLALKETYDRSHVGKLDLEHLCRTATDFATQKPASEADVKAIRKRDLKTIEKYLRVQTMDERAFERTIEEIKYRYYEVARALLKFRGQTDHRYLKFPEYDIEKEIYRKNNWERVMYRGKEQFERENAILSDHLKIEA